ncbi:MAG: alpha-ribazole phosphatase [Firmicutes bacterium]|nr:alpha-ribazole phosphatase [Bacillota bacterium]
MTKVFLVRHGQTVWNKEQRYQGHSDTALSEEGLKQAELTAVRLDRENLAAVYASDLSRAAVTAEIIARHHKETAVVVKVPELREINFGQWEGLTYEQINQRWPGKLERLYRAEEDDVPGGESFHGLQTRAVRAIERLVNRHQGQTIAIVSHGGTIRTIIAAAMGLNLKRLWNIRQDNTAVNIIEYYPGMAVVGLVNDIHHLRR